MFYSSVEHYQLPRDQCSALAFDSAAYNETSWSLIKPYFRLAVPIFDPIHKIFNSIAKGYDDNDKFATVKIWHQKSRNVFINSHQRRRNYQSYLAEKGDIEDAGSLNHVLSHLLPSEVEEILDSSVINVNEDVYRTKVNEALNQTVSYAAIPPKLITGL